MKTLEKFIVEYINNKFYEKSIDILEYLKNKRNDFLNDNIIEKIDTLKENLPKDIESFYKDIFLKFILNEMLNQKDDKEIHRWIVKDWGGIKTHKDFDTLKESMKNYSFDRISSWSKIASFKDLSKYVIYDSRVIYSLIIYYIFTKICKRLGRN
jgi:hypothetical protein